MQNQIVIIVEHAIGVVAHEQLAHLTLLPLHTSWGSDINVISFNINMVVSSVRYSIFMQHIIYLVTSLINQRNRMKNWGITIVFD